MTVRRLVRVVPVLALLGCSAAACADQLYKWVDERGVTNYSDQPPSHPVKKGVIENRVSVYTPDPALAQATQAERARALEDLRTGRRSREIEAEWLARQYLAAAQAYSADPCMGSSDPRCTGDAPYTYVPVGGFFPGHSGFRFPPRLRLKPGTIAGNVTGSTGFIPGTSAFASSPTTPVPRVVLQAPPPRNGGGKPGGGHRR